MSEMIELVAKAICPVAWEVWPDDAGPSLAGKFRLVCWDIEQTRARKEARAAIEVISKQLCAACATGEEFIDTGHLVPLEGKPGKTTWADCLALPLRAALKQP